MRELRFDCRMGAIELGKFRSYRSGVEQIFVPDFSSLVDCLSSGRTPSVWP
jgi:hypothetical protein